MDSVDAFGQLRPCCHRLEPSQPHRFAQSHLVHLTDHDQRVSVPPACRVHRHLSARRALRSVPVQSTILTSSRSAKVFDKSTLEPANFGTWIGPYPSQSTGPVACLQQRHQDLGNTEVRRLPRVSDRTFRSDQRRIPAEPTARQPFRVHRRPSQWDRCGDQQSRSDYSTPAEIGLARTLLSQPELNGSHRIAGASPKLRIELGVAAPT
jgi:hypothetical protein